MKKKIGKNEFKRLVEQKVDEAWYNNSDDFYRGVGKAATIGAIGAGSVMGGGYLLDKGLEQNDNHRNYVNADAAYENTYGDYDEFCKAHNLDPDKESSTAQFDEYTRQTNENASRYARMRSMVEGMVRNELSKRMINEDESENVPYEAWENFLNGKTPVFEFEDGLTYVDYDENDGTINSGHVTNVGFHKDGEVSVEVYDGDFQGAIEELYDKLCSMHEPLQESSAKHGNDKRIDKAIKESVKNVLNEGTGTVSEIREAQEILMKIMNSSYIPFASPSPSSTELEIKKSIIEAMRLLDKACYLDMKCYGSEPKATLA